jgi:hypothetical protein
MGVPWFVRNTGWGVGVEPLWGFHFAYRCPFLIFGHLSEVYHSVSVF